jgi:Flp pilus assembly protein TadG
MIGALNRLLRSRAGNSAVELALLAPLLAAGMLAAFDLSVGFSRKLNLVAAADRAAALATAPGMVRTDYSFLRAEAIAAAGVTGASATVSNWLECNGTRQQAGATLCEGGQEYSRYLSVNITAPYQPILNYGGLISASGVTLTGRATVRIQ